MEPTDSLSLADFPETAEEPTTIEDVLTLSVAAVTLAGAGPDLAYAACAHMFRNRLRAVRRGLIGGSGQHRVGYGDGTWRGVSAAFQPGRLPAAREPLSRAQLRAMARVCRVAAGEEADITRGATRCHRHDEAPRWARSAEATALIGDLIFYRE